MEFNKPVVLKLTGILAENFKHFKSEITVYFLPTETGTKPKEVQVTRLKNWIGSDPLRLYETITKTDIKEETISTIS